MEYKEDFTAKKTLWDSHCHTEFEIICILEGDITLTVEGRKYRLSDNQIAILPPMSFHTISSNSRMRYRRMTALFEKMEIPGEIYERFLRSVQEKPVLIHRDIPNILNQLWYSLDKPYCIPLQKSLLVQIFYIALQEENPVRVKEPSTQITAILEYIDENICKPITLADISKNTYISQSTISHIFVREMKTTVKQYILQKKLTYGENLILSGENPTQVAHKIGYGNYSNFYRIYRKFYGKSPSGKV